MCEKLRVPLCGLAADVWLAVEVCNPPSLIPIWLGEAVW